jgi:probable HAF family extracellular repeat protein
MRLWVLSISVLVAPGGAFGASLGTPSFTGLGFLNLAAPTPRSEAFAIAADGSTVVGRSDVAEFARVAFRWTRADGMIGLGSLDPAYPFSTGLGISADASVVVGHTRVPDFNLEAFRWTAGGGMVGLGYVQPFHTESEASGVSADGSVVVGTSGGTGLLDDEEFFTGEAFRWTNAEGIVGLGFLDPAAAVSWASGVSGDGAVVVGRSQIIQPSCVGCSEAFRWTSTEGLVGLGSLDPSVRHSIALGISFDGASIVGASRSPACFGCTEAFRWTAGGGMVGLGFLNPAFRQSEASGVSGDGSVVVGSSADEAFLWTADDGMRSLENVLVGLGLDLNGWNLQRATGVSADGLTIAGTGVNPDGRVEAWIAHIPEPSSSLLSLLGLTGAAALRRLDRRSRRRRPS